MRDEGNKTELSTVAMFFTQRACSQLLPRN